MFYPKSISFFQSPVINSHKKKNEKFYQCTLSTSLFTIIYYTHQKQTILLVPWHNLFYYILFIQELAKLINSTNTISYLILEFFQNDDPKIISLNTFKKILTPLHLNSGVSMEVSSKMTTPSKMTFKDDIYNIKIWRNEEFNKVLLHELIHSYKLDYGLSSKQEDYNQLSTFKQLFCCINSNLLRINESVTDALAIVFNCICIIQLNNLDLSYLSLMLQYEFLFVLIQVAKLFFFFGFTSWSSFLSTTTEKKNNTNNVFWNEDTSGFSYIFLKSWYLFKIPEFLTLIKNDYSTSSKNINSVFTWFLSTFPKYQYDYGILLEIALVHITKKYTSADSMPIRMSCFGSSFLPNNLNIK